MNLKNLNDTVILIDTDFLNERISENLHFYKELYPEKDFENINLAHLLYLLAFNARLEEVGRFVDIIFAYTVSNSKLIYCEPNDLTFDISCDGVQFESDIGTFVIRSFFADIDESCSGHFINILRSVYSASFVSRIIIVSDNSDLNDELKIIHEEGKKNLLIFKKHRLETAIQVEVTYVNIDYLIGYALGLDRNEI